MVSLVASTLFSPGIDHLFDLLLVVGIKLVELSEEGLPEDVLVGFSRFVEQVIRRDGEGFGDSRQLLARRLACISVFELLKVAFAGIGSLRQFVQGIALFQAMLPDLVS